MIGSGIFIAPSLMAKNIAAPGLYLGLWALAGVFTLLGAFSYGELAAMMPEAGGQYVYLRRALGPLPRVPVRLDAVPGHPVGVHRRGGDRVRQVPGRVSARHRRAARAGDLRSGALGDDRGEQRAGGRHRRHRVLTFINTRGVVAGARVQNVFTGSEAAGAVGAGGAGAVGWGHGSICHFSPAV